MSRTARPRRPRPIAYRTVGGIPSRPICLSTSRGSVKLAPGEAVALAVELLAVAGQVDPAAGPHPLVLSLAERCYAQSELLTACAIRKE